MTIIFALERFFPLQTAGTEQYVLSISKYLLLKKWNVRILISSTRNLEDYNYEGIPVSTFQIPRIADKKELNGLVPPRGIEKFIEKIKILNPDIVHFHSFGRAINGFHLEAVKKLGIKTAFTTHLGGLFCIKGNLRLFEKCNCDGKIIEQRCLGCIIHSKGYSKRFAIVAGKAISLLLKVRYFRKLLPATYQQCFHKKQELRRLNKYADIIFSISPWIDNMFVLNGLMRTKLIPQTINSVFFKKSLIVEKKKDKIMRFVFVGRIHPFKGFHLLQKAWDAIDIPNAELHVIANVSENDIYYKNIYKWANNSRDVVWNEGFTQLQVAKYLNNMDVLILPSISNEVAPLVILEAATRKIPVIGSDYIAIRYMIKHEYNGLLFHNGNWQDLGNQILRLRSEAGLLNEFSNNINLPPSQSQVYDTIISNYKA